MTYQDPEQMRRELAKVVSDPALIDATIEQYLRSQKKKPARKIVAKQSSDAAKSEKRTHEEEMESASLRLGAAIDAMLSGHRMETPSSLKWSVLSGEETVSDNFRKGERYEITPKQYTPARGNPCFKCGANPEHGCKHMAVGV